MEEQVQTTNTEEPKTESSETIEMLFVKALKTLVPKNELEQYLWIAKSGLFVKSEYFFPLLEHFCKFYQQETQSEISIEKARKKLFNNEVSDSFYLLIGNSVVTGSVFICDTKNLRGAGIRLYEGIPLSSSSNIHQGDPVFSETDTIKAKLSRNGYVALIDCQSRQFEIPFDQVSAIKDYFFETKDLRKYLKLETLRSFLKTFSGSLKRAKPFSVQVFTVFPDDVLRDRESTWLRIGDTLLTVSQNQINRLVPLAGRAHQEMIRSELNALAVRSQRRRIGGAMLSLKKGSFFAAYEVLRITHNFGFSAFFSFLDAAFEFHKSTRKFPARLSMKTSVEEIVKALTSILRDAQPILFDKVPSTLKEHLTTEISTCLVSQGEWYFMVDRVKMIRQVFYIEKKKEKVVVPIKDQAVE